MKRLFAFFLVFATLFTYQIPAVFAGSRNSLAALPLLQDIKSAVRQAEARFESGNVTGAAELARRILEKYPNNADAQALLDKCIATEKAEYEEAIASLDATKLADFKQKYPSSSYNDDVSHRIDDLPLWLTANDANTIEWYKKYLAESTYLVYKQEAEDAIKELSVKQAYDAAVAKNTIQAYRDFMDEYPDSKYEKDASNKIARLLADKFNAKSSYADKAAALAYAQNEMTRDYVNNKYNKATSTKGSTTTYSSSAPSTTNTTSSSTDYRTSHRAASSERYAQTDPSIAFGIEASGEYFYGTYLYGIGPCIRFGRSDGLLFATAAIKYARGGFHESYTDYSSDYRSWEYVDIDFQGDFISVPLAANLNLFGFYFGGGIVYNHSLNANSPITNISSLLLQMGIIKRHWDIKLGMNLYPSQDTLLTFLIGGSVYF